MADPDIYHYSLEIVPLDCNYIPADSAISAVLKLLEVKCLDNQQTDQWSHTHIQLVGLIDPLCQELICPSCGKKDSPGCDFFFPLVEMLSEQPPDESDVEMECCGSTVKVLSIDFGDKPKFAKFGFTINNRSEELDKNTIVEIGDLLGCPVAQFVEEELSR